MLLGTSKPAAVAGVENIQTCKAPKISEKSPLATYLRLGYFTAVNELIESGDPRAKVVGKRRPPAAGDGADWERFNRMQQNFQQLWGSLPWRKGVYRFKTMEEFDEWKTNLMIQNAPGRR